MAAKLSDEHLENVLSFIRDRGEVSTKEVSTFIKKKAEATLNRLINNGKIEKVQKIEKRIGEYGSFTGLRHRKKINYYRIKQN